MSTIALSPAQEKSILAETRRELVATLIAEHRDNLRLMSPSQLAGLLDVNAHSLLTLGIPRIEIAPKVIRYRVTDVEAYLEKITFRPGRSA